MEKCPICSNGFAIWVCAEDLNPEWWGQQSGSAASHILNFWIFSCFLFLLVT